MSEPYLEVAVPWLSRRAFRQELERIRFLGHKISWHEAGSEFTIRGPVNILLAIKKAVDGYNADLGYA